MTIQTSTLSSGLRIVTNTVKSVESVALGVWVDVGTRNEDLAHNGVAHMVEHMMFNGTPTRSSQDIAAEIERVGGQMNAYTSREVTAYYIHLLKEDTPLAMDVLSDMILRPTFPDHEIEKERGVILQEIGMTLDTPDDYVFDMYQKTAYPDQALGAQILGTADIIQSMPKDTLFGYVERFYNAENIVVSASGNIEHDDMIELAEKYFADIRRGEKSVYNKAAYKGGSISEEKDLEQSHVVTGFQGVDKNDSDYYKAILLSTILGGGMASRLFQEVREKRGLAYSIYSSHTAYHDDGQFEIYAGTSPDKTDELTSVVNGELDKIKSDLVSEEELLRAKAQLKAGILMGQESMLSRTNRQAKYLLNFGKAVDIQDIISKIDVITAQDIQSTAGRIFSGQETFAILGPKAAA